MYYIVLLLNYAAPANRRLKLKKAEPKLRWVFEE
jgi:hypothetical protein